MKFESYIKAIFGTGRSGTTWLGSIVNSHPEVAYRFEPFHRLPKYYLTVKKFLESSNLSHEDIAIIYNLLIEANPVIDKPPFFKKNPQVLDYQQWAWLFARSIPILTPIYQNLYTPKNLPTLVFKEVNFEEMMLKILQSTSIPIVYIVRHPCGNILSLFKGQEKGNLPMGRYQVLPSLLQQHDSELAERYIPCLDSMNSLEKTALLWRIDVEKAITAINLFKSKGLLLSYEQLCEEPHKYAQLVFKHFNLNFTEETKIFLDHLCSLPSNPKRKTFRNKDWMTSYFTVNRNPQKQRDLWKKKISSEEQKQIENIVKDSWAFNFCASFAGWD